MGAAHRGANRSGRPREHSRCHDPATPLPAPGLGGDRAGVGRGRPAPAAQMMARIAVCEDDPAVRGLLRRALAEHTIVAVGTGSELLARLAPPPDLVILDLGLPDADGRDVC